LAKIVKQLAPKVRDKVLFCHNNAYSNALNNRIRIFAGKNIHISSNFAPTRKSRVAIEAIEKLRRFTHQKLKVICLEKVDSSLRIQN